MTINLSITYLKAGEYRSCEEINSMMPLRHTVETRPKGLFVRADTENKALLAPLVDIMKHFEGVLHVPSKAWTGLHTDHIIPITRATSFLRKLKELLDSTSSGFTLHEPKFRSCLLTLKNEKLLTETEVDEYRVFFPEEDGFDEGRFERELESERKEKDSSQVDVRPAGYTKASSLFFTAAPAVAAGTTDENISSDNQNNPQKHHKKA
jgi:hypothetical protein